MTSEILSLLARHAGYVKAITHLSSNGTTVASRKAALAIRDAFECDLRAGAFRTAFLEIADMDTCTGVCQDNACPVHGIKK